jgi:hypothetical protein
MGRQRLKMRSKAAAKKALPISQSDQTTLNKLRAVLQEKFHCWEKLRPAFLPGLIPFMAGQGHSDNMETSGIEEARLWLPSSIPASHREVVCVTGLPAIESRIRAALCHDTLDEIRYTMRVKSRMIHFKNQNIAGQHNGITLRAVIDQVHDRIIAAVCNYQMNHHAKQILDGPGSWELALQELRDKDIRSYVNPQRTKARNRQIGINKDTLNGDAVVRPRAQSEQVSQGISLWLEDGKPGQTTNQTRKELLWIWTTSKSLNIDNDTNADNRVLRCEWCKSHTCSMRSKEEVTKI